MLQGWKKYNLSYRLKLEIIVTYHRYIMKILYTYGLSNLLKLLSQPKKKKKLLETCHHKPSKEKEIKSREDVFVIKGER